jgi:hypothetical protein
LKAVVYVTGVAAFYSVSSNPNYLST